jgi:hypothetical protein
METETIDPIVKRKGGRPPKAKADPSTQGIAPTADQWAQMMDVLRANKDADQEVAATIHARAMKKALRPENEISPMISVYSYPEGDTLRPRPKPSHIFMQGPFPMASPQDYNTSTVAEIELMNRLQPGDYMVTKADGTAVKVAVKTEFESNGTKPYKTVIHMPMQDSQAMSNWVPLLQLLSEIVTGETPQQSFARYQAIIDRQAAEIVSLKQAS